MLMAVVALVVGARSVDFLLKRISTPKVIRMLGSPTLIGLPLLFAATGGPATGFLALLEPGDEGETSNDRKGTSASEAYVSP
jgi:hypothetical protein